jgi:hypothetical protein
MKLLRTFFGLFIIAAAIYMGCKVLPPYIASFQLEESIDDTARLGTADHHKSDEEIQQLVVQEAQKLGIDLAPEQIQVERKYGEVLLWADYTVHINVPFHPFDLHFQPMSNSKKRSM